MRKIFLLLLLLFNVGIITAQRITANFKNVSMPEALKQINRLSSRYAINFIFNDLEDFRVTTSVNRQTVPDALRQIIGFYPISATIVNDSTISVECNQKSQTRYKGRVVDEEGNPIEFANISLLSPADSAFLTGGVSNESGYFTIPCERKSVIVRLSYVGFKILEKEVSSVSIGTVRLHADHIALKGVTVNGHRPQYKMTDEGLQTNVAGTVLSKAGTAEDVLKHVPSVIHKNDGWQVFGRGEALIYLNGKQLQDLSELDRLSSDQVKSVEVISNPGAKYNASVKAVIKVRTLKAKGDGLSVNARSYYRFDSRNNVGEYMKVGYRHNGLNLEGAYEYKRYHGYQHAPGELVEKADTLWDLNILTNTLSVYEQHWAQGRISYDFGKNQSIGAKYSISVTPYEKIGGDFSSVVTANSVLYDKIYQEGPEYGHSKPTHRFNIYYDGQIGKTTIDFNTDLFRSHNIFNEFYNETSQEYESRQFTTVSKSKSTMAASKLELTTPLLEGSLDYGIEYIHTNRKQLYRSSDVSAVGNSNSEITEQTVAPFAEYKHSLWKGSMTAGLRYEYVDFNYHENGIYKPEQSRTFSNLFPSVSYSAQIGKTNWQLAYSAKTQRPTYSQLSSDVSYANRFLHQSGNPLLRHETDHSWSLSGVWKFMQLSAQYTDKRNAIIYWMDQDPDNESVNTIVYKNQHSLKELTMMVSAAPTIGFWSPQLSAAIVKPWLSLDTSFGRIKFNKPITFVSFDNTFSLPSDITVNLQYGFMSKGNSKNAYVFRNQHVLDVSVSKCFFHNALSVQLKGNDLFYQNHNGGEIYTDKTKLWQDDLYNSRSLEVRVRYNFNVGRDKYKGKGAGQEEINRL